MTINCNDNKQLFEIISHKQGDNNILMCRRGLKYLLKTYIRDAEGIMIVPDDYNIINEVPNATTDVRIHQCDKLMVRNSNTGKIMFIDIQIVKESDFIDMVKEHLPYAIDALCNSIPSIKFEKYFKVFKLDKEKLAKTFTSESRRCWEIAKDRLMYSDEILTSNGGIFYLFNSIRLPKVATQMCKRSNATDIISGYDLTQMFEEMRNELEAGNKWDYFEKKYESIFEEANNELLTESQKKPSRKKKNEEQKEEGSTKKRNKGSK